MVTQALVFRITELMGGPYIFSVQVCYRTWRFLVLFPFVNLDKGKSLTSTLAYNHVWIRKWPWVQQDLIKGDTMSSLSEPCLGQAHP